jgi:anti-sigma-K factor RskA
MTHDEANELLAALALDAVSDEERTAVEEHVAQCPRCRSELDGLREVAAALGNSVATLPEGLWPSISKRIYEHQNGETTTPPLDTRAIAVPVSLEGARASRSSRTMIGSLAAMAAAVVIVVAATIAHDHTATAPGQQALKLVSHTQVVAALSIPNHRLVNLDSASDVRVAQLVVLPDGQGYLVNSSMPALAATKTYQLWGFVNNKAVSIGLMGRSPRDVAFTVSGSPSPSRLAVTVEPAGGTRAPTGAIVASGAV